MRVCVSLNGCWCASFPIQRVIFKSVPKIVCVYHGYAVLSFSMLDSVTVNILSRTRACNVQHYREQALTHYDPHGTSNHASVHT